MGKSVPPATELYQKLGLKKINHQVTKTRRHKLRLSKYFSDSCFGVLVVDLLQFGVLTQSLTHVVLTQRRAASFHLPTRSPVLPQVHSDSRGSSDSSPV